MALDIELRDPNGALNINLGGPNAYVLVNGTWKKVDNAWIIKEGSWKQQSNISILVNDEWKTT